MSPAAFACSADVAGEEEAEHESYLRTEGYNCRICLAWRKVAYVYVKLSGKYAGRD